MHAINETTNYYKFENSGQSVINMFVSANYNFQFERRSIWTGLENSPNSRNTFAWPLVEVHTFRCMQRGWQ